MARQLLYFLVLALLTFGAYSNHFDNAFHFDDFHTVVDNARVHSLEDPLKFFRDPTAFSVLTTHQVFRPVVSLSLALDWYLSGGAKPRWFHISTFFWFLVLLAVFRALFGRLLESAGWAWFATAIFAFHPVSAETVNYIIQRGDLYATLGIAAGLLIYAAFPAHRQYGLYLIPFAIGALGKTTALIFPVLLAWYAGIYEGARGKALLARTLPALAATAAIGWWAAKMTGAAFNPGAYTPGLYRATQTYITLHYFENFFLPFGLTADTDLKTVASYDDPRVIVGVLFLALLAGAIAVTIRNKNWRDIAFGLGWFVIALIPTAVVALAEVANDHRMFMAFPGLCLAVTRLLKNLLEPRMAAAPVWRYGSLTAGIAILAGAAYGAHQRNEVWRSEETLWRDVTIKSPGNGRGLMNYGLTLMARGATKEALDYFERAAVLTPNYSILEINRAIAKEALGRPDEAEPHFLRAIQLSPDQSSGYFYYGRWLFGKGRREQAEFNVNQAVRLNPSDFNARALLAQIRAAMQRWKELGELVEDTLRLAPNDASALHYKKVLESAKGRTQQLAAVVASAKTPESWLELSLAHFQAGRYMDCVHAAEEALKLRPGYAEAYNNIAAGYNALEMWDQGIKAATEAVRLKPNWDLARNNLAHAVRQKMAKSR